jgi:hypothetical protein
MDAWLGFGALGPGEARVWELVMGVERSEPSSDQAPSVMREPPPVKLRSNMKIFKN